MSVDEIIKQVEDDLVLCEGEGGWVEMGGKGSGHWRHAGRKGKKGGSAPSKRVTGTRKISGGQANIEWGKAHPNDLNQPEPWAEALIKYDKTGKPVAYLTYSEDDSPEGTTINHIEYVQSHQKGAGTELVKELQKESDIIWLEAQTASGYDMAERTGFTWLESGRIGEGFVWVDENMPVNKRQPMNRWLDEFNVFLDEIMGEDWIEGEW